ncbi:MAG: class I SAM-dependent methyltransferase [Hyphomicrobiaceae bacterium]
MERTNLYEEVNQAKANFDRIYSQTDPRDYFRVLHGLDYVIPDLGKPIFRNVVAALQRSGKDNPKVLDLGCSYGINAALLRYPLDWERLGQRYRDMELGGVKPAELVALDAHYFASWPREFDGSVIGLDVSAPAIDYAKRAGLLDNGVAADLESGPLGAIGNCVVEGTNLIISTGCIGYVGSRTFEHLLAAIGQPSPWIASFVLRTFGFDAVEKMLSTKGYVTEKLEGVTFVQRRFHSAQEAEDSVKIVRRRELDPAGKEAEGLLHAEFYLSRPASDVEAEPLSSIVSVTSGAGRSYGRRFRLASDRKIRLIK